MHTVNKRRARIWGKIRVAVAKRIAENEKLISECKDEDLLKQLLRINNDDNKRLAKAQSWMDWHLTGAVAKAA